MTTLIAFVSQKGGVGKSTLARALAREAAASGLRVKIADLDPEQTTIIDWHKVRTQHGIDPPLSAELMRTVPQALAAGAGYDLLVIDGPAKASAATLQLALSCHLLVQPTGGGRDDLVPAVRVFHGLVRAGAPAARMVFALNGIGTEAEAEAARIFITEAGYDVLPGYLPERPAYRLAQNEGYAVTETRFPALKERADKMIQAVVDRAAAAARKGHPKHG